MRLSVLCITVSTEQTDIKQAIWRAVPCSVISRRLRRTRLRSSFNWRKIAGNAHIHR